MKLKRPNRFKLGQQTKVERTLIRSKKSMVRQFRLFLSIFLCFLASSLLSSCAIDVDNDIKWRDEVNNFKSLWSFDDPTDYTFDENQVEIKNGKAMLKEVDQFHSGDDFSKGTHVGTSVSGSNVTLLAQPTTDSTHVNSILPSKSPNLVGYWRFDGDYSDTANSFDLDNFGNTALSSDSKLGERAVSFDGNGDYLTQSASPSFDLSIFTISAWVKPDNISDFQVVISKDDGWDDRNFWLAIWDDGRATIRASSGGIQNICSAIGSTDLRDGNWHHIVATLSGSECVIYVNGVVEFTDSTIGPPDGMGELVYIGRELANISRDYAGQIDELAVWNSPLKASEVLALYNSQNASFTELSSSWTPHYDKLVGYWKMDGNWQDSSGNGNHGTVNGDPTFSSSPKVGSHAGSFDGTGDSIDVGLSPLRENSATRISFLTWVYVDPTSFGSTYNVIAETADAATGANDGFYFLLDDRGTTVPENGISLAIKTTTGVISTISPNNVVPGAGWYHIGFSYDGASVSIYINGKLSGSTAETGDFIPSVLNMTLAARNSNANNMTGLIDEAALFTVGLTTAEIKTIYDRQKQKYAGHYDSPVVDLGASSDWRTLVSKAPLPFHKELTGSSSESSSEYSALATGTISGLVGYWNFNETSLGTAPAGTDFRDQSAEGIHLSQSGISSVGTPGLLDKTIYFDGVDDLVSASTNLIPASLSSFTFSLWTNGVPQDNAALLSFGHSTYNASLLGLYTGNSAVGQAPESIRLYIRDTSNVEFWGGGVESYGQVLDGKWHHIVGTYDGSNAYLYVDGRELATKPIATVPVVNFDQLAIGALKRNTMISYYKGAIDEVSIWSRAITPLEVQQLYRRGANRIKYQVKSCVDSSCNCKSFSTTPAGSINDCDGDGTPNSSDTDDVHLAEFMGPGGNGGTYFSELFNRQTSDITFTCSANTTDSDANVCVDDEITFAGSPKATAPGFTFADFPASARPADNRYFQYRVIMEAEENTACGGEPCLPELESIEIGPTGRYFGGNPSVVNKTPFPYEASLKSLYESSGGSCTTSYQISNDGTHFYYWDGSAWVTGSDVTQANDLSTLNNNIESFTSSVGFGNFFFRTYLGTSNTSNSCEVDELEIKRNRK